LFHGLDLKNDIDNLEKNHFLSDDDYNDFMIFFLVEFNNLRHDGSSELKSLH